MEQSQIDFYCRNGYLKYGPLLSPEEVAVLREQYDLVIEQARREKTGTALLAADEKGNAIPAEQQQVFQVMNACERNIHYRRLIYHPAILEVVSTLMGPYIQLFHDQMLYKPAHTGGPVPWHQDNAYWKCKPANLMSCWLTLDDVVAENGAMQVIPGSHLTPVWHEDEASKKTPGVLLDIPGMDTSKAVVVDLPAGGCMFHHCQTLHYTQPNTTDRQRRAFAIHFMPPGTITGGLHIKPGAVTFSHPVLRMGV